jgi:hypothetical protein
MSIPDGQVNWTSSVFADPFDVGIVVWIEKKRANKRNIIDHGGQIGLRVFAFSSSLAFFVPTPNIC